MNRALLINELINLHNSFKFDNDIESLINTNRYFVNIFTIEQENYYRNNYNIDYRISILFDICNVMLYQHTMKIYRLENKPDHIQYIYYYYIALKIKVLEGIQNGYQNNHF